MRLFSTYTEPFTRRYEPTGTPAPDNDFWYSKLARLFGVGGISCKVDENSAMGLPAVYACVRVLTNSACQLPLNQYEKKPNDDRVKLSGTPISKVLKRPNRWQYSFKWRSMMFGHILLRGNCFSQIVRNRRGEVLQLVPLNPTRITVEQTDRGYVQYILDADDRDRRRVFKQDEIFHCTGLTTDGLVGISPITALRRMFEERLSAKEYRARFYENSAQPSGILKMPGVLKDKAAVDRLKQTWKEAHAGVRNAHKVAVLENGLEWQQIGLATKDNQYIEDEQLGIEDIARAFGVPPHKIGHLLRSTNNNIEHQGIEYVQDAIGPLLKNFEEALMFALFTPEENERFYIEFNVDGLLRGDYKTRQEGLAIQRQNGVINANQWRKMENYNAIPGDEGEAYLVNGNMVPVSLAGQAVKAQLDAAKNPDPKEDPKQLDDSKPAAKPRRSFDIAPLKRSNSEVLCEIIGRNVRKVQKWRESNAKKADFGQLSADFMRNHALDVHSSLRSSVRNCIFSQAFATNPGQLIDTVKGEECTRQAVDWFVEHYRARELSGDADSLSQNLARDLLDMIDSYVETLCET